MALSLCGSPADLVSPEVGIRRKRTQGGTPRGMGGIRMGVETSVCPPRPGRVTSIKFHSVQQSARGIECCRVQERRALNQCLFLLLDVILQAGEPQAPLRRDMYRGGGQPLTERILKGAAVVN